MTDRDETEYMLTTVDNPFDPFIQWDQWLAYDLYCGYNTPSFLARVTVGSDELSDADRAQAIQVAIEEICQENVLGIYRKVSRNDPVYSKNS